MSSVRVAIVGVGNCAASLVQGVEYYKDADPAEPRPRADARPVRRLPRPRRRVRRRVRRRRQEGRPRPRPRPSAPARTTPSRSATCRRPASPCSAATPSTASASTTARRSTESDDEPVDVVAGAQGQQGRRPGLLPARRLRGRREVLRPVRHRRQGRASSTPCRSSSPAPRSGRRSSATPACRSSATTSSRQVGATITHRVLAKLFEDRGVDPGPHLPAQRRRQHGLQEHARARPPGVQEDLQDAGRHQQHASTSLGARNVHIGPSDYVAVARRPQVGLRPPRGPRLRRRPAEPRVQARGLGLPELGRRHHRRGALPRRSPRTAASAARSCRRRSYFMKSPPVQYVDDEARDNVEKFIAGEIER